jgi:WD40 repeat protein
MKHFRRLVRSAWVFWLLLSGVVCYGADRPIVRLGGSGVVDNAQFSPDQKYLAILTSIGIEIVDALDFEKVALLPGNISDGFGWGGRNLAFSPDGQLLAVTPGEIWDMAEFRLIHTFPEQYVTFVFSPDGQFLVTGNTGRENDITVYEVGKWEIIKQFPAPAAVEILRSVDVSPDGRFIAAAFEGVRPPPNLWSGSLIVWDFESGKELHRHQPRSAVYIAQFSPAGNCLVYNSGFRDFTLLEVETWSARGVLNGSADYPASLAFDPQTGNVAYVPWGNNVEFRNLENGKVIRTFHGHTGDVRSISISPDGKVMAITSRDGSMKLWDIETGEEIWRKESSSPIVALSFRDNTVLLSCSDKTLNVRKWLVTTGGWETILPAESEVYNNVIFHPTEPILASRFFGTIEFWDISEGELKTQIEMRPWHLSFSSDGAYLASVDSPVDSVTIINYENLRVVSEFKADGVISTTFGTDGLIAVRLWGSAQLWDWENQELKWTVPGENRGQVAFSPNGEFLHANEAVWKIPQQQQHFRLDQVANTVAFSPDSSILAAIPRGEETINLWDTGSGEIIRELSGAQNVGTLAFSPDGSLLAGSGDDGIIEIWQIDSSWSRSIETRNRSFATWGGVKKSSLLQNYPNPFNPDTWIPYTLAEQSNVTIKIHTAAGQVIRTLDLGKKPAGAYISKREAAYWDGCDGGGESAASGVYFYTLYAGDYVATKKMIIAK